MPVELTKGLDGRCHSCGIGLYAHEIAGEIYGWYVDYELRIRGEIDGSLYFCSGCWQKIHEAINEDQGDAILKRKEIEHGGGDRDYKPKRIPGNAAIELFIEENPMGYQLPDNTGVGI
jgi:hypothetical protein